MKILIYSPAFPPLIGGLELSVSHLAEELVLAGHQVVVVTTTPSRLPDHFSYQVVRGPGPLTLLRWTRWCDVFHQANVSLKGLWPLLLLRRPWVVSHHSWYRQSDGRITWRDRLKRVALRFAAGSIAVSRSIAAELPPPVCVIENSYRDQLFRILPGVPRTGGLIFVGRLVSDKGVDLLLEALAGLAAHQLAPRLTILGDGPEMAALRAQAKRLGIGGQIDFLGIRTGEEQVELLNRHRVLVVPSRYQEPFGIVALEGIACGCIVVGSSGGGLADAIGPCGLTFPNGDVVALVEALRTALSDEVLRLRLLEQAPSHLGRHTSKAVTAEYLEVFASAMAVRG